MVRERAVLFAENKAKSGSKQISIYVEPLEFEVLEGLKMLTGLGNTALFNLILNSAKKRPDKMLALLDFDTETVKKSVKKIEDELAALSMFNFEHEFGVEQEPNPNGYQEMSDAEIEAALAENVRAHGAPKVIGTKTKK
ncbi:MAG: hypothetical protein HOP25_02725 [Methylotenera sp.]|nr:hypothetical protein [Methylotenera sp.]